MPEITKKPVGRMPKLVMGGLMVAAVSLTLTSPVRGDDGLGADAEGVYTCPRDDMELARAVRPVCEWLYREDDGCQRACADVLGAVITPDQVALPHPVSPFETAGSLEGSAAPLLRRRGRLEERGWVQLVPGWPECIPCAGNDIDLDRFVPERDLPERDLDDDRFLPFDVPFLWRLIVEYPLRRL